MTLFRPQFFRRNYTRTHANIFNVTLLRALKAIQYSSNTPNRDLLFMELPITNTASQVIHSLPLNNMSQHQLPWLAASCTRQITLHHTKQGQGQSSFLTTDMIIVPLATFSWAIHKKSPRFSLRTSNGTASLLNSISICCLVDVCALHIMHITMATNTLHTHNTMVNMKWCVLTLRAVHNCPHTTALWTYLVGTRSWHQQKKLLKPDWLLRYLHSLTPCHQPLHL